MPMTTAEFKRLKDLLMRAAATDSDPELVQCFRRASVLLATHGHTWAAALDRVVRVVDPVTMVEIDSSRTPGGGPAVGERRGGEARSALVNPPRHITKNDDMERLFEDAMAGASGSFLETLESIHEQWEETGTLSQRQAQVVIDAAERYADRNPGGRVR